MKTLSSMVTPSQTKEWLDILQRLPIVAFFCTSTNAPILVSSPMSQPYRLMNLDSFTSRPSFTSAATQRYKSLASLLRLYLSFFMEFAEISATDRPTQMNGGLLAGNCTMMAQGLAGGF